MKTSELTGAALDWAVAKCEKAAGEDIREGYGSSLLVVDANDFGAPASYSINWAQGGPIIEGEQITVIRCDDDYGTDSKGFCNNKRIPVWGATTGQHQTNASYEGEHFPPQYELYEVEVVYGPTPLIAAMRCYVASKLGDDVELPEGL
jgi:hypothetical protein